MFKLRCYAKKDGDVFVAVCIDLCLAAQGETIQEAVQKLDSQIEFYVTDVMENEKEYAEQLLSRKAPLMQRLTYHMIKVWVEVLGTKDRFQGYIRSSQPFMCGDHSPSH